MCNHMHESAIRNQLRYTAPFVANLTVIEFSERVRQNVYYILSNYMGEYHGHCLRDVNGNYFYTHQLSTLWTWETSGTRLHKRIKSAVYKRLKIQIPEDTLRQIADLAATERNAIDMWIDCVTDFSWEDGDYGDGGSCYWGQYNCARVSTLPRLGASAIRSYHMRNDGERGRGDGRYWIYPLPLESDIFQDVPIYVAYNPYGPFGDDNSAFLRTACIIAEKQHGKPFTHKWLARHNLYDAYVNGTDALIYPADLELDKIDQSILDLEPCISRKISDGSIAYRVDVNSNIVHNRVNLPLPAWAECDDHYEYTCDNCGCGLSEDDVQSNDYGNYCQDCYNELFFYCELCEQDCSMDDHCEIDGISMCESCRDQYCTQCDHCEEWHITDRPRHSHIDMTDMFTVNSGGSEETWCDSCVDCDAFYCEDCDQYHDIQYDSPNNHHGKTLCNNCYDDATEKEGETEECPFDRSPNILTGYIRVTDITGYTDSMGNRVTSDQSGNIWRIGSMFDPNSLEPRAYVSGQIPVVYGKTDNAMYIHAFILDPTSNLYRNTRIVYTWVDGLYPATTQPAQPAQAETRSANQMWIDGDYDVYVHNPVESPNMIQIIQYTPDRFFWFNLPLWIEPEPTPDVDLATFCEDTDPVVMYHGTYGFCATVASAPVTQYMIHTWAHEFDAIPS